MSHIGTDANGVGHFPWYMEVRKQPNRVGDTIDRKKVMNTIGDNFLRLFSTYAKKKEKEIKENGNAK